MTEREKSIIRMLKNNPAKVDSTLRSLGYKKASESVEAVQPERVPIRAEVLSDPTFMEKVSQYVTSGEGKAARAIFPDLDKASSRLDAMRIALQEGFTGLPISEYAREEGPPQLVDGREVYPPTITEKYPYATVLPHLGGFVAGLPGKAATTIPRMALKFAGLETAKAGLRAATGESRGLAEEGLAIGEQGAMGGALGVGGRVGSMLAKKLTSQAGKTAARLATESGTFGLTGEAMRRGHGQETTAQDLSIDLLLPVVLAAARGGSSLGYSFARRLSRKGLRPEDYSSVEDLAKDPVVQETILEMRPEIEAELSRGKYTFDPLRQQFSNEDPLAGTRLEGRSVRTAQEASIDRPAGAIPLYDAQGNLIIDPRTSRTMPRPDIAESGKLPIDNPQRLLEARTPFIVTPEGNISKTTPEQGVLPENIVRGSMTPEQIRESRKNIKGGGKRTASEVFGQRVKEVPVETPETNADLVESMKSMSREEFAGDRPVKDVNGAWFREEPDGRFTSFDLTGKLSDADNMATLPREEWVKRGFDLGKNPPPESEGGVAVPTNPVKPVPPVTSSAATKPLEPQKAEEGGNKLPTEINESNYKDLHRGSSIVNRRSGGWTSVYTHEPSNTRFTILVRPDKGSASLYKYSADAGKSWHFSEQEAYKDAYKKGLLNDLGEPVQKKSTEPPRSAQAGITTTIAEIRSAQEKRRKSIKDAPKKFIEKVNDEQESNEKGIFYKGDTPYFDAVSKERPLKAPITETKKKLLTWDISRMDYKKGQNESWESIAKRYYEWKKSRGEGSLIEKQLKRQPPKSSQAGFVRIPTGKELKEAGKNFAQAWREAAAEAKGEPVSVAPVTAKEKFEKTRVSDPIMKAAADKLVAMQFRLNRTKEGQEVMNAYNRQYQNSTSHRGENRKAHIVADKQITSQERVWFAKINEKTGNTNLRDVMTGVLKAPSEATQKYTKTVEGIGDDIYERAKAAGVQQTTEVTYRTDSMKSLTRAHNKLQDQKRYVESLPSFSKQEKTLDIINDHIDRTTRAIKNFDINQSDAHYVPQDQKIVIQTPIQKRKGYYPEIFTDNVRESVKRQSGPEFEAMDRYAKSTGKEVEWKQMVAEISEEPHVVHSNALEKHRNISFPDVLKTPDGNSVKIHETAPHRVIEHMITTQNRRIATVEEFGMNQDRMTELTNRLYEKNPTLAKDVANILFPVMQGELPIGVKHPHAFLRGASDVAQVSQLSGSFRRQIGGYLIVPGKVGMRSTLSGTKSLSTKSGRAELEEMKVFADSYRDFFDQYAETENMNVAIKKGSKVALSPNTVLNKGINDLSMISMKREVQHKVELLKKAKGKDGNIFKKMWGEDPASIRRQLKNDFMWTDAEIDLMIEKGLSKGNIARIAQRAPSLVNAMSENVLDKPAALHYPVTQSVLRYTSYKRKMGQLAAFGIKEMKKGNFKPFTRALVATSASAIINRYIVEFTNYEIFKRFHVADWSERLWSEFAESDMLGLFGQVAQGIQYARGITDIAEDIVVPPVLSFYTQFVDGFVKFLDKKYPKVAEHLGMVAEREQKSGTWEPYLLYKLTVRRNIAIAKPIENRVVLPLLGIKKETLEIGKGKRRTPFKGIGGGISSGINSGIK